MAFYTACRFITPEEEPAVSACAPNIVSASESLQICTSARGFGNTSLLSVMALYMAAEGVSQTGGKGGQRHWLPWLQWLKWGVNSSQVAWLISARQLDGSAILSLLLQLLCSLHPSPESVCMP
eukprot:1151168-Pelagomonas_calceolata.AAC.8